MNAKPTIDELKAAADQAELEAQEAMRARKAAVVHSTEALKRASKASMRLGCAGPGPGVRGMGEASSTPDEATEPRFERFIVAYTSGTAVESFYPGGATLREVQVGHVLATVEPVEASLVGAR